MKKFRAKQKEEQKEKLTRKDKILYAENFVYTSIEDLVEAESHGDVEYVSFCIPKDTYDFIGKIKKEISDVAKSEKVIITISKQQKIKNSYVVKVRRT